MLEYLIDMHEGSITFLENMTEQLTREELLKISQRLTSRRAIIAYAELNSDITQTSFSLEKSRKEIKALLKHLLENQKIYVISCISEEDAAESTLNYATYVSSKFSLSKRFKYREKRIAEVLQLLIHEMAHHKSTLSAGGDFFQDIHKYKDANEDCEADIFAKKKVFLEEDYGITEEVARNILEDITAWENQGNVKDYFTADAKGEPRKKTCSRKRKRCPRKGCSQASKKARERIANVLKAWKLWDKQALVMGVVAMNVCIRFSL
eukprot:TRINITY_DN4364_c0_g1_i1.p1 TRINITY_DN4364_c0_g1~~TRINITY_DN4364_c0_g1_i1.p1  ORF type:complete len:265 (-),score=24.53 TRINITY_DN4364_c0_g1_i1:69-863(-)